MLACRAGEIKFPCYASPKLDGVRAIVFDGVVYSRSMKPIPNKHIQKTFGLFHGFDGELVFGLPTDKDAYRRTVSAVMTEEGEPAVTFWVFDSVFPSETPFPDRYLNIVRARGALDKLTEVPQRRVSSMEELTALEEMWLEQGFEGAMVRAINAPYKFGRSTEKEGYLMKVKRFVDSDAIIIGVNELMHNDNPAAVSEIGLTKRSSHKENKIPTGTMGSFVVRDLTSEVEFEIGTGFTAEERAEWWAHRDEVVGRIVKYKHFPTGSKDKPRFPVFLGFRSKEDL